MQHFFVSNLRIELWVATFVIMLLLFFCAWIMDVSAATLHVIFMTKGNKHLAPILGFFESLIWLTAISQILQNIDNIFSYTDRFFKNKQFREKSSRLSFMNLLSI